ncbi:MAG: hypothetical protein GY733_18110 [bacterium]|nr:hypothetical protein [bacterium]
MIGWFDIVLLGLLGASSYRLWLGTTSPSARGVSIGCLAFLAWVLVAP